MIGQCAMPPLSHIDPGSSVAHTYSPPNALIEALAADILREDQRMRKAQKKDSNGHATGPLYSTLLTHALYALAVTVPNHAKCAAASSAVRGAAFTQLMKVQQIVSQRIPSRNLHDPADSTRAKVLFSLRGAACVRNALQVLSGSWLAEGSEPQVSMTDEGGRDFVQFCTKHLTQAYGHLREQTSNYQIFLIDFEVDWSLKLDAKAKSTGALACKDKTGSSLKLKKNVHGDFEIFPVPEPDAFPLKLISQSKSGTMALTKEPADWEQLMFSQGSTAMVGDLLLKACNSDEALIEISKMGGQQALLALSRYGESSRARQQATNLIILMTKLAVRNA
jgi:hypothetical protein